ncbi:MAG: spore cortex biosynthesis protein YabQ [Ruminiclostridium sp.]|nr:spore cortex biosynthesis protein YabQ [Ruminiclostridium sp.]
MFETFRDALNMIGLYAAVGFALAVLYNILRFFRLMLPKMRIAAAVSDFLFAMTAGVVLFAYSVDNGMGFFRLYYVFAAAFGFTLNMVTVGLIVPPLARLFGKLFHWFAGKLFGILTIPVNFVCHKATYFYAIIQKYISIFAEKRKIRLQNRRKMMYNNTDHKIGKVYPKGGESRNAIKAKVRKIN